MPVPLTATKHFKLAHLLRERIRDMKPGDSLPTLDELRIEFGFSQATVERAFNRLRKEGLIYRPAGSRRVVVREVCDAATRRIALVRPDWPSAVFESMTRSIAAAGRGHDWALDTVYYRSLKDLDLELAVGENDALVLLSSGEVYPPHLIRAFARPNKPVVVTPDWPKDLSICGVRTNDRQVGVLAVEHLAALGHRRIVLLRPTAQTQSMQNIADGWREAMQRLGLSSASIEELNVDASVPFFEDGLSWTYVYFRQWMQERQIPFTAMVCSTSESVLSATRALLELGKRVPQDVSVVGSAAVTNWGPYLNPPLTSAEYKMRDYGAEIVKLLEEQIADPQCARRTVLIEPTLVPRSSSAALVSSENAK